MLKITYLNDEFKLIKKEFKGENPDYKIIGESNASAILIVDGEEVIPHININNVVSIENDDKVINRLFYHPHPKKKLIPELFSKTSGIKNYLLMQQTIDDSKVALQINGSVKYYDDDKYGSKLVFICKTLEAAQNLKFHNFGFENFLDCNSVEVCYGNLEKEKKWLGNTLFYTTTKEEASHVLVKGDWGGSFNHTNAASLIERLGKYDIIYKHNATSNGGGAGVVYYVIRKENAEALYEYLRKIK